MWVNAPANPWWTVETFGMLIFPWVVLNHRENVCSAAYVHKAFYYDYLNIIIIIISKYYTLIYC